MRSLIYAFGLLVFVLLSSISCKPVDQQSSQARLVKLAQIDGRFTLTVDGEQFFVKGAGCEFGNIAALSAHGANSFRTWRTENGQKSGQEVLDEAQKHGLLVTMGIEIGRERHGFDYNDEESVQEQFDYVKSEIQKYKDHPALLAWGIGNELNLHASNPKVWDAVNEIAEMIHELDPNHPTTTMLAGFSKELGDLIASHAPAIDFLSFQFYADIVNLPVYLEQANYYKPYLVTEWGATGHWESPTTSWGRPIEQNSKEKAESYHYRYKEVIASDTVYCLGSYVFLWGQKQERTPTWYGMFLENGDKTATVDVMHYVWNGKWPDNRTPQLDSLLLNGHDAYASNTLGQGQQCTAQVFATDPENDPLAVHWEIIAEVPEDQQSDGGDVEQRQRNITTTFSSSEANSVSFNGPEQAGEYRLFVYVSDGNGHSATANIPFLVK